MVRDEDETQYITSNMERLTPVSLHSWLGNNSLPEIMELFTTMVTYQNKRRLTLVPLMTSSQPWSLNVVQPHQPDWDNSHTENNEPRTESLLSLIYLLIEPDPLSGWTISHSHLHTLQQQVITHRQHNMTSNGSGALVLMRKRRGVLKTRQDPWDQMSHRRGHCQQTRE